MRVLVIGGTGFIGKYVVTQLASQGHEVLVYHRGHTQAVLPDCVRQVINPHCVMPIQEFTAELFSFGPDAVIHTVAMGSRR